MDGCVKVYTSRIDSVASETGKLLSGLADSGETVEKESTEEGEEGAQSKRKVLSPGNLTALDDENCNHFGKRLFTLECQKI